MSEPFVAEIRIFAGNFAPRGWAFCNGQQMPVSQNTALFSILGKIYGGDGRTNFNLPDLQGCAPMHQGEGPGLTARQIGAKGGAATVTLLQTQMPAHTHEVACAGLPGNVSDPGNAVWSPVPGSRKPVYVTNPDSSTMVDMNAQALAPEGGGMPHNNMQPYLGLSFIIALQGVYPARN